MDANLVKEERMVRRKGIYECAPVQECLARIGKAPVNARWADADKGEPESPSVRCR